MKKWLIRAAIGFGVLVAIIAASWTWTLVVPAGELEIGPETTVVEGPVRANGTVDYAAALNERLSEGVTPQNNAYVVIARLLKPDEAEGPIPEIRS